MTVDQLNRYFDKSCYKGFNDNPQGFFSIFKTLFSTLEKEEEDYKDINSDENLSNFHQIKTSFGKQTDKYEEVYEYEGNETSLKIFYNKWLNFSTQKSFSWCDKYKPSDAPDRRIRRLIEKENKKLRDSEKKKYNDCIRSLAAAVKKQDPRVKAFINEQKEKEKLKKLEEKDRRKREKEERLKNMEEYQEQEWMKVSEDNEVMKMINDIDDEDIYKENDEFYCIACNKQFRSEKQWENHQNSKKHLKAVRVLRKQLMEEMGEEYVEEEENNIDNDSNGFETIDDEIEDEKVNPVEEIKNDDIKEINEKIDNIKIDGDTDLLNQYNIIDNKDNDSSDFVFVEEEIPKSKKNKKGKKKSKTKQNNDIYQDSLFESSRSNSFDSLMNMDSILSGGTGKKKNKNKKKKKNIVSLLDVDDFINETDKGNEDDNNVVNYNENDNKNDINENESIRMENIDNEKDEDENENENENEKENNISTEIENNNEDKISELPQTPKKLKGKKAKEARMKARKEKEALAETRCRVCNEQFNSKNALFNHIKETGHSIALPEEIEAKSKKKGKKRR